MNRNKCIITVILLFLSSTIASEVILMRNGEYVNGKILSENANTIVIQLPNGTKRYLNRSKIRRIVYMTLEEKKRQKQRTQNNQGKTAAEIRKEKRRQKRIENLQKQQERINKQLAEMGVGTENEKPKEEPSFFSSLFGSESSKENSSNENYTIKEKNYNNNNENIDSNSSGNNWPYTWRSALVPGWGQYEKGQTTRAGAFFLGALATGALLYSTNQAFTSADADYKTNSNLSFLTFGSNSAPLLLYSYLQEDQLYQARNTAGVNRLNASILFIAFYTWNLIDAWWFSPTSVSDSGLNVPQNNSFFSISILPERYVSNENKVNRYESRFTLHF